MQLKSASATAAAVILLISTSALFVRSNYTRNPLVCFLNQPTKPGATANFTSLVTLLILTTFIFSLSPRPSSHLQPFSFLLITKLRWTVTFTILSTQFGGLYARVVEVTNDKNTRKMLQPVGSLFLFLSLSLFLSFSLFSFFSFLFFFLFSFVDTSLVSCSIYMLHIGNQ